MKTGRVILSAAKDLDANGTQKREILRSAQNDKTRVRMIRGTKESE